MKLFNVLQLRNKTDIPKIYKNHGVKIYYASDVILA